MEILRPNTSIRVIRAREGLTQKEFGESLGVSTQTVALWEKNTYTISTSNLIKLCSTYHVSTFDLLGI